MSNTLSLIGSICGTIGGILLVLSYIPQIQQLKKTKNSEGLSRRFFLVLISAIGFMIMLPITSLINLYGIADNFTLVTLIINIICQILNFGLATYIYYLIIRYRKVSFDDSIDS